MSLTRDHAETIKELIHSGAEFRSALLEECRECLREDDAVTAKRLLTYYVETIDLDAAGADPDALRRTLDPDGDAPDADVLAVIEALREREEASSLAVPAGAQP